MTLHKGALGVPGLLKSSGNMGPGDGGMGELSMAALERKEGPSPRQVSCTGCGPSSSCPPSPLCPAWGLSGWQSQSKASGNG